MKEIEGAEAAKVFKGIREKVQMHKESLISSSTLTGEEVASWLNEWSVRKGLHPYDFDDLFVHELLDMLYDDKEGN